MPSELSYFNPLSNDHHAYQQSLALSQPKQIFVWAVSIIVGLCTLGVGGVALFRVLNERFSKEMPSKQRPEVTATTGALGKDILGTMTKEQAIERLQNLAGWRKLKPDEINLMLKIPQRNWDQFEALIDEEQLIIPPSLMTKFALALDDKHEVKALKAILNDILDDFPRQINNQKLDTINRILGTSADKIQASHPDKYDRYINWMSEAKIPLKYWKELAAWLETSKVSNEGNVEIPLKLVNDFYKYLNAPEDKALFREILTAIQQNSAITTPSESEMDKLD